MMLFVFLMVGLCHFFLLIAFVTDNELSNNTADLLTETCSNVTIEPILQPLSGEALTLSLCY